MPRQRDIDREEQHEAAKCEGPEGPWVVLYRDDDSSQWIARVYRRKASAILEHSFHCRQAGRNARILNLETVAEAFDSGS